MQGLKTKAESKINHARHGKLLEHPQTRTGYRRVFLSRRQAKNEIFDYIEAFYNRQRIHSALDYRPPVDFELQNN